MRYCSKFAYAYNDKAGARLVLLPDTAKIATIRAQQILGIHPQVGGCKQMCAFEALKGRNSGATACSAQLKMLT